MFPELLARCCTLPREQVVALEAHYQLLLRWNKSLNLTRITRLEEAVERHYCESIFVASHLPAGSLRIADIGSGAGFPGFPIAIVRPESSVTLIESQQRKAVFLKEASRSTPNIKVLAVRADVIHEQFDWVVSRAVSYSDLGQAMADLAPNAALLTGADEPPSSLGFAWERPVALPWGQQRFLRLGRLSRNSGGGEPGMHEGGPDHHGA